MEKTNVSKKDYAISILLVLTILSVLLLLKLYIIPVPKSQGGVILAVDLHLLVFSIVTGIVANVVFLLAKKPFFLIIVAVAILFSSPLCNGALFTTLYTIAILCLLGSIPFIALQLAKIEKKR